VLKAEREGGLGRREDSRLEKEIIYFCKYILLKRGSMMIVDC